MMAVGVALRAGTFSYHGAPDPARIQQFYVGSPGAYSDIASLYFRNRMWLHALPL